MTRRTRRRRRRRTAKKRTEYRRQITEDRSLKSEESGQPFGKLRAGRRAESVERRADSVQRAAESG